MRVNGRALAALVDMQTTVVQARGINNGLVGLLFKE